MPNTGGAKQDKKEGEIHQPTSPMEGKIVNDTTAWARALAELRGRNVEWAERAVKESLSVSAAEAVREHVVEFEARDLNDLLRQLEGREAQLSHGTVRLSTVGVQIHTHEMWWGERILAVLANPNVAFLLVIFGFYGILFELYTPGWGVAGTLGIVCLMLGFFALAIRRVAGRARQSQPPPAGGHRPADGPWGVKVALVEVKHVDLPDAMKRAMAKQAENERERRAKVIHAEGEFQAAKRLRDAAETFEGHPMAMQMRFLQTLVEVGAENNTTIVFPVPLDLISPLLAGVSPNGKPKTE